MKLERSLDILLRQKYSEKYKLWEINYLSKCIEREKLFTYLSKRELDKDM